MASKIISPPGASRAAQGTTALLPPRQHFDGKNKFCRASAAEGVPAAYAGYKD